MIQRQQFPPTTSSNGITDCLLRGAGTIGNEDLSVGDYYRMICVPLVPPGTVAWYGQLRGRTVDCGYWITEDGIYQF